ncbi:MAG: MarR family transcriptional regulator [Halobacteria archaeon]
MPENWDKVSFVLRGPTRSKALRALDSPKTPTQLARELKIDRPSASRTLLQLEEEGLVACLTPDARKGRLYRRTALGNRVLKHAD